MTVDKTMRILTIYCLFYDCEEAELREITDHIPVSKKTIQRNIRFLKQAGLIRSRFDHKAQAFIPQSTEGIQPVFPENKTQRRYMERIIRLCTIITHIDGEENPIGWYEEQFPGLSVRTRQRADNRNPSTDPTTENDSFNTKNNTAGQYPCLAGLHTL